MLIIGLGGLGSPVAMYLAAAGVGELTLVDDDVVDLTNLQRQIVHNTGDINHPKVESARESLLALNPDIRIHALQKRLSITELLQRVKQVDVVVDATDNFATRFGINQACVHAGKPLVSGAAIRLDGQVAVFRADIDNSPCYRCLYRDESELEATCSENGVLAPMVGIIGSIQALETIKVITGFGEDLNGRLLILDGNTMEWRSMRLKKDPACPVCGQ